MGSGDTVVFPNHILLQLQCSVTWPDWFSVLLNKNNDDWAQAVVIPLIWQPSYASLTRMVQLPATAAIEYVAACCRTKTWTRTKIRMYNYPCSGVLEHFTMAIFYFSCYINGKLKSTNSCEVDMNVEKWAIQCYPQQMVNFGAGMRLTCCWLCWCIADIFRCNAWYHYATF